MSDPDFASLAAEVTEILQRYIRIDTTNPPGNEQLAADFLAEILASEGLASRALSAVPGRANLIATLPAEGSGLKPLVLLNHTDVVPVEAAHWEVPPFAGVVKDGFVWGRGALDMKGMGIIELIIFLTLKRRETRLRRPLTFLAVADEEAGSEYGVEWLDREHAEALDAAFVVNEGGYGGESYLGVERPFFGVGTAEKSPLWLRLRTTGRPGHASAPHEDNCVDRLVRAMHHIQTWDKSFVMTEEVARALEAAHAEGYLKLDPAKSSPAELVERYRQLGTILSNTISATGFTSGIKHNVIPAVAEATLDCRLVPGYDQERFLSELRRVLDDAAVEVETVFSSASPASPMDTKMNDVIRNVCHEVVPEAAILPRVSPGFTDSRVFRRRGVPAYGFVPMLLGPSEMGGQHGHNERVSLKNLRLAVEVLYKVVYEMCAG